MNKQSYRTAALCLTFLIIIGCVGLPKTLSSSDVTIINSWIGLPNKEGNVVETRATYFRMSNIQTIFHRAAFTISNAQENVTYTLPVSWKLYLNNKLIATPKATATSTGAALATSLDIQPGLFGSGEYRVELYVGDDNKLAATNRFEIR